MYTLTLDHLNIIHAQFLAPEGMRNITGLCSALERPASLGYYARAVLALQVATHVESIAAAHAYVDANKRTATAAGLVVLRLNGADLPSPDGTPAAAIDLGSPEDPLGAQVVAFVTHALSAGDVAAWLRERLTLAPGTAPVSLPCAPVLLADDQFETALAAILQAHAPTFAYLADR